MRVSLLILIAAVAQATADAQITASADSTSRPPRHSVAGVVFDSIHGRPLRGAEVMLAGTPISAVTDPFGRFRFDSLAPGEYQVAFFHPLLDSISLAAAPQTLSVPLMPGKGVMLALPSIETLVKGICRTDSSANASILVGRIEDPDTRRPVPGANVFVLWTDFKVNGRKELIRTPRTLQGTSDSTGAYRVCGLPGEVDALAYASNENSTTSRVPVASKSSGVLIRNLSLEGLGGAGDRKAAIAGIVKTAKGVPVAGATISVNGSDRTATTNAKGEYSLTRLPAGTRNVLVRRIGFAQVSVPIELTSEERQSVNVVLSEVALVMDPMYVRAQRDRALTQVGFAARRKRGLGDFRTRSDFERDNPRYLSDIVGRMRGVRLDYVAGRRTLRGIGQGADCISMFIDGMLFTPTARPELENPFATEGELDDAIFPDHIAAIEVYTGSAVPPEFETPQARGCLAVIIWTRTKVKDF